MSDWSEDYRPTSIDDVVGNEDSISDLISWFKSCDGGGAVLHGPPGIGKTSAAHAIGGEYGYEVHEVNASDKRTKEEMEDAVLENAQMYSFSGAGRLIVVDEADALHSGGARIASRAIDEAKEPIIFIVNDLYEVSKSIREKCELIEFGYVDSDQVAQCLIRICQKEGVTLKSSAMQRIVKGANGDLRAAVNDLESTVKGIGITEQTVRDFYDLDETSVFVAGPRDMEDPEARNMMLRDEIETYEEMVIRGESGFDLVAGEYAEEHGMDLTIVLPIEFEVFTKSWNEIEKIRLESLLDYATVHEHNDKVADYGSTIELAIDITDTVKVYGENDDDPRLELIPQ